MIGKEGFYMKIPCDIIKDLLPLYNDGVCSEESVNAVEEHLTDCPDCTKELEKLKEDSPADMLKKEENDIIGTFRRSSLKKLLFLGVCLVIFPFINLLFTLMYGDSRTAVNVLFITVLVMLNSVVLPAVLGKGRKLVIIISSLAVPLTVIFITLPYFATLLSSYEYAYLNAVICVPVSMYLILSAVLIPLKIRADHDSPLRLKKAGLRLAAMETALLIPLSIMLPFMFIVNYIGVIEFYTFYYSVPFLIFVWGIALLNRLLKTNHYIKISAYIALIGLYLGTMSISQYCTEKPWEHYYESYYCFWQANLFSPYPKYEVANVSLMILIVFFAAAATLFIIGKREDKKILETNSQSKE